MREIGYETFFTQRVPCGSLVVRVIDADVNWFARFIWCEGRDHPTHCCQGKPPCRQTLVRLEGDYLEARLDAPAAPKAEPAAALAEMLMQAGLVGAKRSDGGLLLPRFQEGDVLVVDRGGPELRVARAGDDMYERVPKQRLKVEEPGVCTCSVRRLMSGGCARRSGAQVCEEAPNGLREAR